MNPSLFSPKVEQDSIVLQSLEWTSDNREEDEAIDKLRFLNDPSSEGFVTSICLLVDTTTLPIPRFLKTYLLDPYIWLGRKVMRHPADVAMFTQLILYPSILIPSAICLYRNFSWFWAIARWAWQTWVTISYTNMMHQHIHHRGILAPRYGWIDYLFPYITNPLFGHTWNSYYYHHVEHHHHERNRPTDLSSTMGYQRDSLKSFLQYVGRFILIGLELPLYFWRRGMRSVSFKVAFWENVNLLTIYFLLSHVNARATTFVFILPLVQFRLFAMVGNWGQHAFVDRENPDLDISSVITVIDPRTNRYGFNDGYHATHHLYPHLHWTELPSKFLEKRNDHCEKGSLVFKDIDFSMVTMKLLRGDYKGLVKHLVPIGNQNKMSLEEKVEMLQDRTKRFTKYEMKDKFKCS